MRPIPPLAGGIKRQRSNRQSTVDRARYEICNWTDRICVVLLHGGNAQDLLPSIEAPSVKSRRDAAMSPVLYDAPAEVLDARLLACVVFPRVESKREGMVQEPSDDPRAHILDTPLVLCVQMPTFEGSGRCAVSPMLENSRADALPCHVHEPKSHLQSLEHNG